MGDPMTSFKGKTWDQADLDNELKKFEPHLKWLVLNEFSISMPDAAELASRGLAKAIMWRELGDTRDDVRRSLRDLLTIDADSDARQLLMAGMAIWAACKDIIELKSKTAASAIAGGLPLPMEKNTAKLIVQKLQEARPGLFIDRTDRPSTAYLGLIETMFKNSDVRAERITAVMSEGDVERTASGDADPGRSLVSRPLRTEDDYKAKIATMGLAWSGLAMIHPEIHMLEDLRMESFERFGAYALGPRAGGALRADGGRPHFSTTMAAEFKVRCAWFDSVEVTGCSLNTAILNSIGANPTSTPSGLWQSLILNELALGTATPPQTRPRGPQAGGGGGGGGGGGYPQGPALTKRQKKRQRDREGGRSDSRGKWSEAQQPSWKGGQYKGGSKGGGKQPGGKGGSRASLTPRDGGKASGKAKGGSKGLPSAWTGKLVWCLTHKTRICFDHHLSSCALGSSCPHCHSCCPQPNCSRPCDGAQHGLWSH